MSERTPRYLAGYWRNQDLRYRLEGQECDKCGLGFLSIGLLRIHERDCEAVPVRLDEMMEGLNRINNHLEELVSGD